MQTPEEQILNELLDFLDEAAVQNGGAIIIPQAKLFTDSWREELIIRSAEMNEDD